MDILLLKNANWYFFVTDANYVFIENLVKNLIQFNSTDRILLGIPAINHASAFNFSAGILISEAVANDLKLKRCEILTKNKNLISQVRVKCSAADQSMQITKLP